MKTVGKSEILDQLKVARNVIAGMSVETLASVRNVIDNDYSWLRLSNATTQDVVLPDATALSLNWNVVIDVPSTSAASVNVKTYHETTPVLLKNVLSGKTFRFTLVNKSSAAGTWKIEVLTESEISEASRYVGSFTATTEWGSASNGFYTQTIPASTHGMGTNPIVQFSEITGEDYNQVELGTNCVKIYSNGNVEFKVPSTPDLRFAGRVIIL